MQNLVASDGTWRKEYGWSIGYILDRRLDGCDERDRTVLLLELLTAGEFAWTRDAERKYRLNHGDPARFVSVCWNEYEQRLKWTWDGEQSPWADLRCAERFMSSVMDECVKQGVRYPKGWNLCASRIRARLKVSLEPNADSIRSGR